MIDRIASPALIDTAAVALVLLLCGGVSGFFLGSYGASEPCTWIATVMVLFVAGIIVAGVALNRRFDESEALRWKSAYQAMDKARDDAATRAVANYDQAQAWRRRHATLARKVIAAGAKFNNGCEAEDAIAEMIEAAQEAEKEGKRQ